MCQYGFIRHCDGVIVVNLTCGWQVSTLPLWRDMADARRSYPFGVQLTEQDAQKTDVRKIFSVNHPDSMRMYDTG